MSKSREHIRRASEFLRMATQLQALANQFGRRAEAELDLAEVESQAAGAPLVATLHDIDNAEAYLARAEAGEGR